MGPRVWYVHLVLGARAHAHRLRFVRGVGPQETAAAGRTLWRLGRSQAFGKMPGAPALRANLKPLTSHKPTQPRRTLYVGQHLTQTSLYLCLVRCWLLALRRHHSTMQLCTGQRKLPTRHVDTQSSASPGRAPHRNHGARCPGGEEGVRGNALGWKEWVQKCTHWGTLRARHAVHPRSRHSRPEPRGAGHAVRE